MGNRLSKIYTRTGDKGTTGLAFGDRVPKHCARMEAIGTADELNCAIGLLCVHCDDPAITTVFHRIQHELFDLGGELSMPPEKLIDDALVTQLEADLDRLNEDLPPLKDFILPGGSTAAAFAHQARAICRRAERCGWRLADEEEINPALLKYLNRLSDLLFIVCRVLARAGDGEVLWVHRNERDAKNS